MEGKKTKVVAIIQCDFAKERCSGFACLDSFAKRIDAFKDYPADPGIIAVPFNCGGCPGRRIPRTVAHLVKSAMKKAGVEKDEIVFHLSSCMVTDNGHYPPCPHLGYIEKILDRKGVAYRKGSYGSKTATLRRASGKYEPFDF